MLEYLPNHAFLDGALALAVMMVSVLLYMRSIDSNLMRREIPLDSELTVCLRFRMFIALGVICALVTTAAILKMGLEGSSSELVFAMVIVLCACSVASFLVLKVFLTSTYIEGDTVVTNSPLGRKEIHLSSLLSININDCFQFELEDSNNTVRFCHFVESKRALIEHIIAHAPGSATKELRAILERSVSGLS
jgi:hypothetical protein